MLDPTAFYRELFGPVMAPRPGITGVVVRETAHTAHHPTRRRVVFLAAQAGNGRHGNRYTERAVQALVQEIKRHPKIYMGHQSDAAIHAGTERHLSDLAGVAVRESVHYDPALKAVVGDIECTPSALDIIDLAHAAGDTIGVSVEGVGQPASAGSRDVVGWLTYRGACLVPEGGAGGMTVREAATGAALYYDEDIPMTTTTNTQDFLAELMAPIAKTAAVRESAAGTEDEGTAIVREAKANIRARHRRFTDEQAAFVLDRAIDSFVSDPYGCDTLEDAVIREADAYAETLPPPLGREGSIRAFDAFIDSRNGR